MKVLAIILLLGMVGCKSLEQRCLEEAEQASPNLQKAYFSKCLDRYDFGNSRKMKVQVESY